MGKIISFVNKKGGSGKTTSTTNVAYCLTSLGKKVLVIDFDSQANTSYSFGCDDYVKRISIVDLLRSVSLNQELPDKNKFIFSFNGLDLICCNESMDDFQMIEMPKLTASEFLLNDYLERSNLINEYDYIVIDNSPATDLCFKNALVASNYLIIPCEADAFNLQGMMELITKINLIFENKHLNLHNTKIVGLLFTKCKRDTILSKQLIDEFAKFNIQKFESSIPEREATKQAQAVNSVVCKEDPKNKVSIAYMNFTKELLKRIGG